MTDIRSFDWQRSWTREALEGLDASLKHLAESGRDGLDMLEHAETLIGLGYVALQAYVSSAMSDLFGDATSTERRSMGPGTAR